MIITRVIIIIKIIIIIIILTIRVIIIILTIRVIIIMPKFVIALFHSRNLQKLKVTALPVLSFSDRRQADKPIISLLLAY